MVNSRLQDFFDGSTQPLPMLAAQPSDRTRGSQPGKKPALTRIEVPRSHDYRRIQDKVCYGLVESLGTLERIRAGKRLGKRLWSQVCQAGVLQEFRCAGQKAHAETSCVMKAQL